MSPFTPQLRPLSVGEALDAGFRLMRERFGTLVLCVLVPLLPVVVLGTLIVASTDSTAFDLNTPVNESDTAVAGTIVGALVQSLGAALAVAACFKAISAAYFGERAGAGASLRYALARFLPLLGLYVLLVLIILVGLVALIIPGIFLAVRLAVALPAVVVERGGPFKAIERSWKLTRGNWWRTFATLLVVAILLVVINIGLTAALTAGLVAVADAGEVVVAVLSTLGTLIINAIVMPLWASVVTVVYYDLRVRNEGLDLQLLARDVGAGSPAEREEPAGVAPSGPGGFAPPSASA